MISGRLLRLRRWIRARRAGLRKRIPQRSTQCGPYREPREQWPEPAVSLDRLRSGVALFLGV